MVMANKRPETTTVSIRIERQTLERLRGLARRLSHEWDRDMGYADLIRDAVNRMYPVEEHPVEGVNGTAKEPAESVR